MSNRKSQSQYAATSGLPLIKSPSLRLPPPVELPPDIHPLPDSVTAYFVYPFTLEPHILTVEASRRSTLTAHATHREAYLTAREEDKERWKREALRKIAPGFEPMSTPLIPTKRDSGLPMPPTTCYTDDSTHRGTKSVMEELIDHLEALDSK